MLGVQPLPQNEESRHHARLDPGGSHGVLHEQLAVSTVEAMGQRLGIESPVLRNAVLLAGPAPCAPPPPGWRKTSSRGTSSTTTVLNEGGWVSPHVPIPVSSLSRHLVVAPTNGQRFPGGRTVSGPRGIGRSA